MTAFQKKKLNDSRPEIWAADANVATDLMLLPSFATGAASSRFWKMAGVGADVWNVDDPDVWQQHLSSAPDRVRCLGKEKLTELDEWFFHVLPGLIKERAVPSLTSAELVKLV